MDVLYPLRRIHGILDDFFKRLRVNTYIQTHKIKIMSSSDTIEYILKKRCSVSRFGDGELNMIFDSSYVSGFQSHDEALAHRLRDIILDHSDQNILICLPYPLLSQKGLKESTRRFWFNWDRKKYRLLYGLHKASTDPHYRYGDAYVTRPYITYLSPECADRTFPALKTIWDNQDILIVEGTGTRLGVGNDLLNNAASVKRILAPSKNAFSVYNQILESVKTHYNGGVVLLALGLTATVLAYDLSAYGIWAIDIGHFDIEYEWYRSKAKKKVAIAGKAVNEVVGGYDIEPLLDDNYWSQVVDNIS